MSAELCLLRLIVFLNSLKLALSLSCIQCDRSQNWYSAEENERHIRDCQKAVIEPTKCTNTSHTHCIYSYFREDGNSRMTITERRCGRVEDIIGCTLFKSNSRRIRRHLINGGNLDHFPQKRRETALFVEVCTDGCEGDGCTNFAYSSRPMISSLFLMICT
uniref:Uncharacterized protein n=1 Tax=Acrobeloides nanus TaxID=290746 RepID=A0A914CRJ7_9BILA